MKPLFNKLMEIPIPSLYTFESIFITVENVRTH